MRVFAIRVDNQKALREYIASFQSNHGRQRVTYIGSHWITYEMWWTRSDHKGTHHTKRNTPTLSNREGNRGREGITRGREQKLTHHNQIYKYLQHYHRNGSHIKHFHVIFKSKRKSFKSMVSIPVGTPVGMYANEHDRALEQYPHILKGPRKHIKSWHFISNRIAWMECLGLHRYHFSTLNICNFALRVNGTPSPNPKCVAIDSESSTYSIEYIFNSSNFRKKKKRD